MFKKVIILLTVVVFMFTNLLSVPAFAVSNADVYDSLAVTKILNKTDINDLKAKSAILMDAASGNVLFEKSSHERLPLASVTKVMSMLLVMEAIDSGKIKFEDKAPVSEYSASMGGSQAYLKPGEEFTVSEMLKAVAVHSSNDVTVALAEFLAGSEGTFVGLMNDKAKQLGMNNTNFLDCTGLTDEGHYSSAYDIAIMSRELIVKHPKILEYTSIWHDTFRNGTFSLDNTNKLIKFYQGCDGLKTGFTTKAGYNLSATAIKNGMRVITVVQGEPDTNTRFAETRKLFDFGFSNFELAQVNNKGDQSGNLTVKKGVKSEVKAIYGEDVKFLVAKGSKNKIERAVTLDSDVVAPIKAGQKIGEVVYKLEGKELGKSYIVAESSVEKASFIRLFFRMVIQWFGIGRAA
ncbi:MAG: D-alanyl-D-alanine carboxypeptidase [Clostridia bacterium]|nr:D-alanyl-D-alanine carboxypeptidase [Clostridia bacterium]